MADPSIYPPQLSKHSRNWNPSCASSKDGTTTLEDLARPLRTGASPLRTYYGQLGDAEQKR